MTESGCKITSRTEFSKLGFAKILITRLHPGKNEISLVARIRAYYGYRIL